MRRYAQAGPGLVAMMLAAMLFTTMLFTTMACRRSGDRAVEQPVPTAADGAAQLAWDLGAPEVIAWQADDDRFSPAHAVEASGLTAAGRYLYVALEKYGAVLEIDREEGNRARVMKIAVPVHSELEGVSWADGRLYLCDEAHATVYEVVLPTDGSNDGATLPARELPIIGVGVRSGKVGLEGIAVAPGGERFYLTLERQEGDGSACAAVIYRLRLADGALHPDGDPLPLPLPGCDWRLTDLLLHDGQLLSLMTRFPDKRYELVTIDPETGERQTIADLTDLTALLHNTGYADNLEGMALSPAGDLYLVSDNAMTGIIDDPVPPLSKELTLLFRLPRL